MSSKTRGAFLEPFSAEDNNAEMGIMSEFLPPRLNGSGVGAPLTEGWLDMVGDVDGDTDIEGILLGRNDGWDEE